MSYAALHGGDVHGNAGIARLTKVLLAFTVFCGGFVFIEPSPYELAFAFLCCILTIRGLRVPGLLALPLACLALWACGGVLSIAANGQGGEAVIYVAISAYLGLSTIVFAAMSAERPESVIRTIRAAWLAAALVTASAGIIGYFHLLPGSSQFELFGRARGMFKDPNVFAPFLILPALLLFQDLLAGTGKRLVFSTMLMSVLLAGLLLSFSRAAWGNMIGSGALMAALMFLTAPSNRRRIRIIGAGLLGVCMACVVIGGLLAIPAVRDIFFARAELIQDYDAGTFGRFGTQLRSLSGLLQNPFGFGPHGFGMRYDQDPHNVYLNAFASYGWLGGLSYLLLVLTTLSVGFRAVLIRTGWQPFLIAVYAAYVGVALEGAVIDTDHWRHYFLLAGLTWGLAAASFEHARQTYLRASM